MNNAAQLEALKAGLLFAAFVVGVSFFATGSLPGRPIDASEPVGDEADQAS